MVFMCVSDPLGASQWVLSVRHPVVSSPVSSTPLIYSVQRRAGVAEGQFPD